MPTWPEVKVIIDQWPLFAGPRQAFSARDLFLFRDSNSIALEPFEGFACFQAPWSHSAPGCEMPVNQETVAVENGLGVGLTCCLSLN